MSEELIEFEALDDIPKIVIGVQNGQPLTAGPWKKGERGKLPETYLRILVRGGLAKAIDPLVSKVKGGHVFGASGSC